MNPYEYLSSILSERIVEKQFMGNCDSVEKHVFRLCDIDQCDIRFRHVEEFIMRPYLMMQIEKYIIETFVNYIIVDVKASKTRDDYYDMVFFIMAVPKSEDSIFGDQLEYFISNLSCQ